MNLNISEEFSRCALAEINRVYEWLRTRGEDEDGSMFNVDGHIARIYQYFPLSKKDNGKQEEEEEKADNGSFKKQLNIADTKKSSVEKRDVVARLETVAVRANTQLVPRKPVCQLPTLEESEEEYEYENDSDFETEEPYSQAEHHTHTDDASLLSDSQHASSTNSCNVSYNSEHTLFSLGSEWTELDFIQREELARNARKNLRRYRVKKAIRTVSRAFKSAWKAIIV